MGTVRKTITVTDHQDHWSRAQIEAGRFANDSELIRDLIRFHLPQADAARRRMIRG